MPLNRLIGSLEEKAADEVEQLITRARERAESIADDARGQAELRFEIQMQRARREAEAEAGRVLHRANQQAGRIVAEALREVSDQVLGRVKSKLSEIRNANQYPEILERYLDKAWREFPAEEGRVVLLVAAEDEQVARRAIGQVDGRYRLQADLETMGGLELTSEDGLIRTINTFESRFEQAEPELRRRLATWIQDASSPS